MTEQEQLESIRALIQDATKDTKLWLAGKASEEERVHVRAIQGRLADLDGIIMRQMQCRSSAKDAGDWPETVREVLSRLDQAGKVRGNIVGKSLTRLAERLPQELPGSQPRHITKASAPIMALSGTGGWTGSRQKPTQKPPNPPSSFPLDLWTEAGVILDEACEKFPNQTQTLDLCKHVVSKMMPLFCRAVKIGRMKDYAVFHKGLGGMEDLVHLLLVYNCDSDNERFRLAGEVRNSEEWRESRRAIAAIANAAAESSARAEGNSGRREASTSTKRSRLSATISCPSAARRMEVYLQSKGISQTNFAGTVNTTDRTLRAFRKTGRVRRDIFEAIARAMNISKEELLKSE